MSTASLPLSSPKSIGRDLISGVVVFLVALPLCLGIALASNTSPISGLIAGIVGGIVVGMLSGSHTSVSGPAAGLTAIVAAQLAALGDFRALLLAVTIAGLIQIGLGIVQAGTLSAFVPSSVIKGLLAAIGVILILKQIPHLVGHDTDPEGDMSFFQPDNYNTFSEFMTLIGGQFHTGALTIGVLSLVLLIIWDRIKVLKKSIVPAPLLVVVLGVGLHLLFKRLGGEFAIGADHLVQVPVAESVKEFRDLLVHPDFSLWLEPKIYTAALTIAIVASLETLLNLEAVDKLDPQQRQSPPTRELLAQGCGNLTAGLIGGIPITSVIVRSSVNIHAGSRTKLSAIVHGFLLLICVMLLPTYLNLIPISCLAAILLVTGFKLASPKLFKDMWALGRYQFVPFIVTLSAIVMTDLLIGILIGLAISVAFILNSNLRRPMRRVVEKHLGGDVLHIELANQVSFLNRAALEKVLWDVPRGQHLLLDARQTDYIDPDILQLIREFKEHTAPIRGVRVSLSGFRDKYQLQDDIQYVDYSTRELQGQMSADDVLSILKDGNDRFRSGKRLTRDLGRQIDASAKGQHPLAVILSCIDSRTPSEIIFDLGLGDVFSVRVAGNVTSPKVLGSMEYGVAVAGAKLILVLGHTQCGAVNASVNFACTETSAMSVTGCEHLEPIVHEIQQAIPPESREKYLRSDEGQKSQFVNDIAVQNVRRSVHQILSQSAAIRRLVDSGQIRVIGGMYDVASGRIDFFDTVDSSVNPRYSSVAASVSVE